MIINGCDFVARMIIVGSRRVFSEDNFCLLIAGFVIISSRRIFCKRNFCGFIFSDTAIVYFGFVFDSAFLFKIFSFWFIFYTCSVGNGTILILYLLYFRLNTVNISSICDSAIFVLMGANRLFNTINRRLKDNCLLSECISQS